MFENASKTADSFDPQATMEELAARDPRMAMVIQLLQQQRGQVDEAAVDESDDRDALIAELGERLDSTEARLVRMTQMARKFHAAHREDRDRLGELASALGACGLCWGEDDHCQGCRGRGQPGMMRPDMEMRARLFGARKGPHRVNDEPPKSRSEPDLAAI